MLNFITEMEVVRASTDNIREQSGAGVETIGEESPHELE